MVKKSEIRETDERKDNHEENKDIFNTWIDSYNAVSRMWEDSYFRIYKPWFESTGEVFRKAVELSKDAAPEEYKEFYDLWAYTCQKNSDKLYQMPTLGYNKETFEKFLVSAEESNKIYRSWIVEFEENSRVTREVLNGEPDIEKYKKVYDMWIMSYGKIFDELLTLPFRQNIKNILGNNIGSYDIYSETFLEVSKRWKDSCVKIFGPWIDSMVKLSVKSAELSHRDASPEAFKEFYTIWLNTYQETYGKLFDFQSMSFSKEVFEDFVRTADVNLNLTMSWIATLEKLSQKAEELSKQNADPETRKELYNLWGKTYEKVFDNFFENTPTISPFKEILEPVKNATKIYADTFSNMSNIWVNPYNTSKDMV